MGTIILILLFVGAMQALSFFVLAILVPRWLDRVDLRCKQRQSRPLDFRPRVDHTKS